MIVKETSFAAGVNKLQTEVSGRVHFVYFDPATESKHAACQRLHNKVKPFLDALNEDSE